MLKLRIGNPTLLDITYDVQDYPKGTDKFALNFKPSQTEFSLDFLKNSLIKKLEEFKDAELCLSGGYDSQFLALLMLEAGYNFNVVLYQSQWGLNVINSNDVLFTEQFCKNKGLNFKKINLDAKSFFEKDSLSSMTVKYRSASPQILYHIYFLQQLNSEKIIMGGDVPYITFSNNQNTAILENLAGYLNHYVSPYYIFANQNNIKLLKTIFHESPDIFYQSILLNLEILKKHKVYQPHNDNIIYENYRYKEIYYNTILETPLENRLMCATGFENLKKHYASITGQYDKFDELYRKPLQKIKMQKSISNYDHEKRKVLFSIKTNNETSPQSILNDYNDLFEDIKPTPLKDYLFDF